MNNSRKGLYEFGPFRLDVSKEHLWKGAVRVHIGHKDFQVLRVLVENRGETVEKDRILTEVWGPTADENYLAQRIKTLRNVLGDTAQDSHLIKTIPGEGYRFIGDVTEVAEPTVQHKAEGVETASLPPLVATPRRPQRPTAQLGLAFAGIILAVLLACLYLWERRPTTPGQSVSGTRNYRDLPGFSSPSLLAAQLGSPLTSNADARTKYLAGLAKLRALDYAGAKDDLLTAAASDPADPLIHAALAEAWAGAGSDPDATAEAKSAFELSRKLPSEPRLLVEATYREMSNQWDDAGKIYEQLWESSQGGLEYGLLLADAQKEAGRYDEAFRTLDALKNLPPPNRYDPRIQLQEAEVAEYSQDYERERTAAQAASKSATALGANRVFAEATIHLGWALTSLGHLADAKDAFSEAYGVYAQSGERAGVADAQNGLADVLTLQDKLDEALTNYEASLQICRELEYQRMTVDNLCGLGDVSEARGDLSDANEQYLQCLSEADRSSYTSGSVQALLSLVRVSLEEQPADLQNARKYLDQAEALGPEGIWDSLAIKVLTAHAASSADAREIGPSLKIIEAAADDARKGSFLDLEFDSRLAAAELEFASGDTSEGRRDLTQLEHDAAAKGFLLFARKAEEVGRMYDRR